jgi:exodeoxyribonuclease V alpha subunit
MTLDDQTTGLLSQLHERGVVSAIDVELAHLCQRLDPSASPWVALTAALVSRATQAGHVCLDLRLSATQPLLDADEAAVNVELPSLSDWQAQLGRSPLVGAGDRPTPLVMQGTLVYLQRYFAYEQRLARALRSRLAANEVEVHAQTLALFHRLFPKKENNDLQRRAAYLACTHRLCVISGGPGTGKTSTVAKVLALLQAQFRAHQQPLRLCLLAPTGKAATRLAESLSTGLAQLGLEPETTTTLTVRPATIHRALGYQPRTPTRFRHDAAYPMPYNVVVVDEAAMVDLALMTKLVEAVHPQAHFILLGDRDQLASVEAGAVFGDLFNPRTSRGFSPRLRASIEATLGDSLEPPHASAAEATAIADCTIHLEKSYRYAESGAIAQLARAVRAGDLPAAFRVLEPGTTPHVATEAGSPPLELRWLELPTTTAFDPERQLGPLITEGFSALCHATSAQQRLSALSSFRLLSPHRKGPLGVQGLNQLSETCLKAIGLKVRPGSYPGQPILITENDYQAELYNGDVGVLDVTASNKVAAFFQDGASVRELSLARLPEHTTVFAMTVHKSQGSEFDGVVVVLPHHTSPLLNRELLYTAITRAKRHVTIVASRESLTAAISHRVARSSGLRQALWAPSSNDTVMRPATA